MYKETKNRNTNENGSHLLLRKIIITIALEILAIVPIYIIEVNNFVILNVAGDTMTNLINPPKVKRPNKKTIIREIMETPTPTGGEFDINSLERTNIANLILIRDILIGGAK